MHTTADGTARAIKVKGSDTVNLTTMEWQCSYIFAQLKLGENIVLLACNLRVNGVAADSVLANALIWHRLAVEGHEKLDAVPYGGV